MRYVKSITLIILTLISFSFLGNALALNIQVKKEEVQEAIKHGEEHGKDIFKCQDLKHACINFWPRQGGILVRSKFVDLTVSTAMWFNEGQKISDREIKDIINSPYLKVEMRTKDDVIILLKQGENIIEPVNIDYEDPCCELCKFDGGDRDKHDFVTSSFPYSSIDPRAKATIIVKGSFRDREYNVNLSRMK